MNFQSHLTTEQMESQQQQQKVNKKVFVLDEYYKDQINNKLVNDINYMQAQVENSSVNKLELSKYDFKQLQGCATVSIKQLKELFGNDEFEKIRAKLLLFNPEELLDDLTAQAALEATKSISEKIEVDKLLLKWNPPKSITSGPSAKKTQSIMKYYPVGELFGIGQSRSGKLLIRNVKTSFVTPPAKFGSEQQKQQLETITPNQLEEMREDFLTFKSFATAKMIIDLQDDNKIVQDPQTCQQFRYLMLAQHIIAKQFMNILKQKNIPTMTGFIGTKFYESDEENKNIDYTQKDRATLNIQFAPFGQYDRPIEIVEIVNEPEGVSFNLVNYKNMSIIQITEMLTRKNVDLVIQFDSCSVQKQSPVSKVMPKIIVRAITKQDQQTKAPGSSHSSMSD